ncbi:MAG: pyridoxine 5'-phosphate synthase [Myxococcales bacterium]|nr:pyridoxine 5'-phosphate synthase [Myxococcales bacterium]MCB9524305.1 pyridoxine 5'-phosphate synthase [Myxococcales bacterium]
MDARLHLHLDSVAAFRDLRDGARTPETVAVALLAELAGIDGLALRVDETRRDQLVHDVQLLRTGTQARLELGLAPTADLVTTAFDLRPDRVTLVPDRMDGSGILGGLDVHVLKDALKKHVNHLRDADVEVAVRVAPSLDQVKAIHRLDARVVCLVTAGYVTARTPAERRMELTRLQDAAVLARRLGLRVAVVGGLDLRAVEALAAVAAIDEFHVGHACVARGILRGIERAVDDFRTAIERGRQRAI